MISTFSSFIGLPPKTKVGGSFPVSPKSSVSTRRSTDKNKTGKKGHWTEREREREGKKECVRVFGPVHENETRFVLFERIKVRVLLESNIITNCSREYFFFVIENFFTSPQIFQSSSIR